jgi:hypothetical protein
MAKKRIVKMNGKKVATTLPDTLMAQKTASYNHADYGVAGGRPGYAAQNKKGVSDDMTPEELKTWQKTLKIVARKKKK